MPGFLVDALRARRSQHKAEPRSSDLVFAGPLGTAPRRANFRKRVWLPSLVRAGLLGQVVEVGPYRFRGAWRDREGVQWSAEFTTEREAVERVALRAAGGLRFHDLRHSYASWLVTDGVPVNVVQRVMGHEQASFTLNRYTHAPDDYEDRVRLAFEASADFPLTFDLRGRTDATDHDRDPDS
jgi:integrase